MNYLPDPGRYSHAAYRRCGRSGLLLPPVSLGLWHNFGAADDFENARRLIHGAFDAGITYFDLANNYGPPPGWRKNALAVFSCRICPVSVMNLLLQPRRGI